MKTKKSKSNAKRPEPKTNSLEPDAYEPEAEMQEHLAAADALKRLCVEQRDADMPRQPNLDQMVQIAAGLGQGKDLKERADAREIARQALQLFRECRDQLAESVGFIRDGIERSVARIRKGQIIPFPKRKEGKRFPASLAELKQRIISVKARKKGENISRLRDAIWCEFVGDYVKKNPYAKPAKDHFSNWTNETEIGEIEWCQGVGLELWEWVKQRAKERKAEGQKTGGDVTGEAREGRTIREMREHNAQKNREKKEQRKARRKEEKLKKAMLENEANTSVERIHKNPS